MSCASWSSSLPVPSVGSARKQRARTPSVQSDWDATTGPVAIRPSKYDTGPAVKTSNPRLPPRGANRAVGGIRARAENPGRRASSVFDSTPIAGACVDADPTSRAALAGGITFAASPLNRGQPTLADDARTLVVKRRDQISTRSLLAV